MNKENFRIDNLQYCNWSREIFEINREAKLDAIHVTIAYHEDFEEVKKNLTKWSEYFNEYKACNDGDFGVHGAVMAQGEDPAPPAAADLRWGAAGG